MSKVKQKAIPEVKTLNSWSQFHKFILSGKSGKSSIVLNLHGYSLQAKEFEFLCKNFTYMRNLVALDLGGCGLDDNQICRILDSMSKYRIQLQGLELGGNEITDASCIPLANFASYSPQLSNLNLRFNLISDSGLNPILMAVANHPSLTRLNLSSNCLTDKSINVLFRNFFAVSGGVPGGGTSKLTTLDLSGNFLFSPNVGAELAEVVAYIPNLAVLELTGCSGLGPIGVRDLISGISAGGLSSADHRGILELYLSGTGCGDEGALAAGEFLCSGKSRLQVLDLSQNGITDSGAIFLSHCLSANSQFSTSTSTSGSGRYQPHPKFSTSGRKRNHLRVLGLRDNAIGVRGCLDLIRGVLNPEGGCEVKYLGLIRNNLGDEEMRFVADACAEVVAASTIHRFIALSPTIYLSSTPQPPHFNPESLLNIQEDSTPSSDGDGEIIIPESEEPKTIQIFQKVEEEKVGEECGTSTQIQSFENMFQQIMEKSKRDFEIRNSNFVETVDLQDLLLFEEVERGGGAGEKEENGEDLLGLQQHDRQLEQEPSPPIRISDFPVFLPQNSAPIISAPAPPVGLQNSVPSAPAPPVLSLRERRKLSAAKMGGVENGDETESSGSVEVDVVGNKFSSLSLKSLTQQTQQSPEETSDSLQPVPQTTTCTNSTGKSMALQMLKSGSAIAKAREKILEKLLSDQIRLDREGGEEGTMLGSPQNSKLNFENARKTKERSQSPIRGSSFRGQILAKRNSDLGESNSSLVVSKSDALPTRQVSEQPSEQPTVARAQESLKVANEKENTVLTDLEILERLAQGNAAASQPTRRSALDYLKDLNYVHSSAHTAVDSDTSDEMHEILSPLPSLDQPHEIEGPSKSMQPPPTPPTPPPAVDLSTDTPPESLNTSFSESQHAALTSDRSLRAEDLLNMSHHHHNQQQHQHYVDSRSPTPLSDISFSSSLTATQHQQQQPPGTPSSSAKVLAALQKRKEMVQALRKIGTSTTNSAGSSLSTTPVPEPEMLHQHQPPLNFNFPTAGGGESGESVEHVDQQEGVGGGGRSGAGKKNLAVMSVEIGDGQTTISVPAGTKIRSTATGGGGGSAQQSPRGDSEAFFLNETLPQSSSLSSQALANQMQQQPIGPILTNSRPSSPTSDRDRSLSPSPSPRGTHTNLMKKGRAHIPATMLANDPSMDCKIWIDMIPGVLTITERKMFGKGKQLFSIPMNEDLMLTPAPVEISTSQDSKHGELFELCVLSKTRAFRLRCKMPDALVECFSAFHLSNLGDPSSTHATAFATMPQGPSSMATLKAHLTPELMATAPPSPSASAPIQSTPPLVNDQIGLVVETSDRQALPSPQVITCQAIHEFSTTDPRMVSLKVGDMLEIIGQEQGWFNGRHMGTGQIGFFPPDFVQIV